MCRMTKKLISLLLALVCLTFPIISLSACGAGEGFTGEVNPDELHKFYFEAPLEAFTPRSSYLPGWVKESDHVLLGEENSLYKVKENIHLLRRFIRNKKADAEIFIIKPPHYASSILYLKIRGLYFDGEYFQTHESFVIASYDSVSEASATYKYKTCDIEKYDGVRYLYVANGDSISLKEYLKLDNDGKAAVKEKFLIVASWE